MCHYAHTKLPFPTELLQEIVVKSAQVHFLRLYLSNMDERNPTLCSPKMAGTRGDEVPVRSLWSNDDLKISGHHKEATHRGSVLSL
jgi:hypothetical protein